MLKQSDYTARNGLLQREGLLLYTILVPSIPPRRFWFRSAILTLDAFIFIQWANLHIPTLQTPWPSYRLFDSHASITSLSFK